MNGIDCYYVLLLSILFSFFSYFFMRYSFQEITVWRTYFLVFIFRNDLMKILYFPKNSSNIFLVILVVMQLSGRLD